MTSDVECVEVASGLATRDPVVERHLAACPSCGATAAALVLVRRASDVDVPDLWPRLRARLVERDDGGWIDLRFPQPGGGAAAAVAALVVATLLAPEPGRLLAVMLGVL